jgi:RIO-like serine/threonine protein kinase
MLKCWQIASDLGITPKLLSWRTRPKEESDIVIYQYVDGKNLYAWAIEHDVWRRPEALNPIIEKVKMHLGRLHKAGVIFGDVNAGNVIVQESGKVWLIDWDTAKHMDQDLEYAELMRDLLVQKDLAKMLPNARGA